MVGPRDTWASHEGQQAHLGPFREWKVLAKKTNWTDMGAVCFYDRFLLGGLEEKVDLQLFFAFVQFQTFLFFSPHSSIAVD